MREQQQAEEGGCFQWLFFKTWYPFSTLRSVLILAFVLGIVFISIALIQFFVYSNSYSTRVTYSSEGKCQGAGTGANCEVQINLERDLQPPILLLYTLSGAYINHRKYISSISADQLLGKAIDMKAAEKACTPFVTNKDMNVKTSFAGAPLNPDNIAYPCGFQPFLVFNDSFSLYSSQGNRIAIDETRLNPEYSDLFTSKQGSEKDQWMSIKNDHFQEWTKDQALIGKYKLWGRINQPLQKGKYNLVAANNYKINTLRIAKGVELLQPTTMGGALYFFPISFLIMGAMCIAYAVFLKVQMGDYDQLVKAQK